jgi:L-lactate dehydrogenase complex protein LldE
VALFVTCMVDTLYPDVGMASVDLLEQQGIEVVFPFDQTCCGQPAFNAGYRDEARQVARHFLDVFEPLVATGTVDAIVAPSGSCAAMVVHSFPLLFAEAELAIDLQRAERIAAVTFELTEFLVDVLGVTRVHASVSGRVAYHACCHALRELGIDEQPRMLLASVQNAIAVPLNGSDECCGFGGLFAIKNAPISTAMGERKVRNIAESGADLVALCDVSCMTHINGLLSRQGTRCRAVHIAQLLTGEEQSPEKMAPVEEAAADAPPRRWQDLR